MTLSLTLHTEKLHEDRVWSHVVRLLDAFERRDWRATFFVFPLRSMLAGADLKPRLREISARGHEIGQHTHYYTIIDGRIDERTPTPPSAEQISGALERDHRYLTDAGVIPRGFVSGGWAIFEETLEWLVANGFTYDCSFRSFPLRYAAPNAERGGGRPAPFRLDKLLVLPTTGTLRTALVRRGAGGVYYLHDYDLLRPGVRAALRALTRIARGPSIPAGDVQRQLAM